MHIPANMGAVTIRDRGAVLRFNPVGLVEVYGQNPVVRRTGRALLAARLFVGFNVGSKPTWTVNTLAKRVLAIRKAQGRAAGASFVIQKGIWQEVGKPPVKEDSAQVIIINDEGLDRPQFTTDMIDLAEQLARGMKQDSIYLDIQNKGIVIDSLTVTP